jgi:hypothetical protein
MTEPHLIPPTSWGPWRSLGIGLRVFCQVVGEAQHEDGYEDGSHSSLKIHRATRSENKSRRLGEVPKYCQRCFGMWGINTHRIHVWYICLHLGYTDGKCYHIYSINGSYGIWTQHYPPFHPFGHPHTQVSHEQWGSWSAVTKAGWYRLHGHLCVERHRSTT